MLRRSIRSSTKMLALVLSLSFLWSWAACAALCAEATEHRTAGRSTAGERRAADAPDDCADCEMKSDASIVPERLSAKDAAATVENKAADAFRAPESRSFVFAAAAPPPAPPRPPPASSLSLLCRRRI